jgi:hypothetical protein
MVLDDPAQEMDQPTYRGFCRLLAKLVRLQRKNKQPLSLIVMLHQEDRALDLARDTAASLVILDWKRNQSDIEEQASIKTMRLLSDSYAPISGRALFASKTDSKVS